MRKMITRVFISGVLILCLSLVCNNNGFKIETANAASGFSNAQVIAINAPVSTTISASEDNEYSKYYKFTTSSNNSHYNVSFFTGSYGEKICLEVLDESGAVVKGNDNDNMIINEWGHNERGNVVAKLNSNSVYYIHIYTQTYSSSVVKGDCQFSVSEIKDDYPDTVNDAKLVPVNKTIQGSIEVPKDVDCLKFVVTNSGKYNVSIRRLSSNGFVSAELIDSSGQTIIDYISADSQSDVEEVDLRKGQVMYYILRSDYALNYSVSISSPNSNGKQNGTSAKNSTIAKKNTNNYVFVWNNNNVTINNKAIIIKKRVPVKSLSKIKNKFRVEYKKSIQFVNITKGKAKYKSSNKKVVKTSKNGKITGKKYGSAKVTMKQKRKGKEISKKVTVEVVPKKPAIKSVKKAKVSGKQCWSLKIKKKDNSVTGYQIVASANKKFPKGKSYQMILSKSAFKNSHVYLSRLSNNGYYIKLRAYKKNGKKNYVGAWSNIKLAK